MLSVFDQLDWTEDTNPAVLLQLVSAQLDDQEVLRQRIRMHLEKDYPASALSWLPTVTWNPPTLVPLSSFDLKGIQDWPTWQDKAKIKAFTEKIESGWHKPIVALKIPGARYLLPIDGHTRLSIYWKLKRPVHAWVGKAHSVTGPWEGFHSRQRGMSAGQKKADFASISDRLLELAEFVPGGPAVRRVRSARGVYFFKAPIGTPITEEEYQSLLASRRAARAAHDAGHPDRVAAERAVRQARKLRGAGGADIDTGAGSASADPVSQEVNEVSQSADQALAGVKAEASAEGTGGPSASHSDLLSARRDAQSKYPAGHPERVAAERAVRQSRKAARTKIEPTESPTAEAAKPTEEGVKSPATGDRRLADLRFAIRANLVKHYGASDVTDNDVEHARIAIWLAHTGRGPNVEDLSPEKQKIAEDMISKTTDADVEKIAKIAERNHLFSHAEAEKLRSDFAKAKAAEARGERSKGATRFKSHVAFVLLAAAIAAFLGGLGLALNPILLAGINLLPPFMQELVDRLKRL